MVVPRFSLVNLHRGIMFTQLIKHPGFVRITTSGNIVWIRFDSKISKQIITDCGEMPDSPAGKTYDQIRDNFRLILSDLKEEPRDYGRVLDCFKLVGSENQINNIYLTSFNRFVRVIETGAGRFWVQNWGPPLKEYYGDSISSINGENIILYNGIEEIEFGQFGQAIFINNIAGRAFNCSQKTLADIAPKVMVH